MNNQVQRKVVFGDDAVADVSKYEVSENALQAAIEDGLLEIKQSTDLDAKTDPGSRAWGAVIRGLRRELLTDSEEWSFSFSGGLNLTHNKDKGLNILVMSGDKYTGLLDGNPKSKNPKGTATKVLVGENYELFNPEKEISSIVSSEPVDSMINFVLLYFFDYGNKEVRYELSIPDGMSNSAGKMRIASWKERYIFEAIPFVNKVIPTKEEFNEIPAFTVIRNE